MQDVAEPLHLVVVEEVGTGAAGQLPVWTSSARLDHPGDDTGTATDPLGDLGGR